MEKFIVLVLISLIGASSLDVETFQATGAQCSSTGDVYINSFSVTPTNLNSCTVQSVTMTGTFNNNFCVKQILINQIFNMQQTSAQSISLNTCYSKNQQLTFNFDVTPFQCNSGNYITQVFIQTLEVPATDLSCWEYSYTL